MIQEGKIVLFRFPTTALAEGKLRPALVIRKLPGRYNDWLICMISTQLERAVDGFDEMIHAHDPDFSDTGLKSQSVCRLSRLAVVEQSLLIGSIGQINTQRMVRIKTTLSDWITSV